MKSFLSAALAATAVLPFLAACGDTTETDAAPAQASQPTSEEVLAEKAEQLDVVIDAPSDGHETTGTSSVVRGTVQPADAVVKVDGTTVEVAADGSWKETVTLELGENSIDADASLDGSTARANDSVEVMRKRTAAQRAARKRAQARKRAARLASLRTNAKAIAPKLLQKNPDKFTGETVVLTGEIFQIQEGGDNFFLMNTECETEYEVRICNGPTVHVTYDQDTSKTEEDLVTVYGTVTGGLDYDTAAGGSNYVASIAADIIE